MPCRMCKMRLSVIELPLSRSFSRTDHRLPFCTGTIQQVKHCTPQNSLERKAEHRLATYTDVREQQPGLTLPTAIHEGVCGQAEDVGVVEEPVHLHLGLSLLTGLAVMAKDSLQSIEASILCTLYQVNIAETSRRSGEFAEHTCRWKLSCIIIKDNCWTHTIQVRFRAFKPYPSSSFWMKKYLLLSIVMTLREQIHKACPMFFGALLKTNHRWRRGMKEIMTWLLLTFIFFSEFTLFHIHLFFILFHNQSGAMCRTDTEGYIKFI